MKCSKNTLALRALYPNLRAWIACNLTRTQLEAIRSAPRDCVMFGSNHPLDDERLAASVFRAYRQEAIWSIKYEFENLNHFDEMRGQGSTWDAFYHHALIVAIVFMMEEDPSILAQALMPPASPPAVA